MKKQIELTQEEAQVLVNLINIAVQTKGLEAAAAGAHLAGLIQTAFKQDAKIQDVSSKELEAVKD